MRSSGKAFSQPTEDPRFEYAKAICRISPRSKLAKKFRQNEFERLFLEFIMEKHRYPGSVELAKALNVSPRTVRNYLKERRERLYGPEKVYVHWYGQNGEPMGPPELLTIDECADRLKLSVREVKRQIWEQRRDRIAELRKQFGQPKKGDGKCGDITEASAEPRTGNPHLVN